MSVLSNVPIYLNYSWSAHRCFAVCELCVQFHVCFHFNRPKWVAERTGFAVMSRTGTSSPRAAAPWMKLWVVFSSRELNRTSVFPMLFHLYCVQKIQWKCETAMKSGDFQQREPWNVDVSAQNPQEWEAHFSWSAPHHPKKKPRKSFNSACFPNRLLRPTSKIAMSLDLIIPVQTAPHALR